MGLVLLFSFCTLKAWGPARIWYWLWASELEHRSADIPTQVCLTLRTSYSLNKYLWSPDYKPGIVVGTGGAAAGLDEKNIHK